MAGGRRTVRLLLTGLEVPDMLMLTARWPGLFTWSLSVTASQLFTNTFRTGSVKWNLASCKTVWVCGTDYILVVIFSILFNVRYNVLNISSTSWYIVKITVDWNNFISKFVFQAYSPWMNNFYIFIVRVIKYQILIHCVIHRAMKKLASCSLKPPVMEGR